MAVAQRFCSTGSCWGDEECATSQQPDLPPNLVRSSSLLFQLVFALFPARLRSFPGSSSLLFRLAFALFPARLYKCNGQICPIALTLFEVHVSANLKFQICANTFAPISKCRCRFRVFALTISPDFSVLISILAIWTYISWKNVITKSKMLKCAYLTRSKTNGKSSNL